MCFSAEVSLITYITGLFGCWLIYNNGMKTEALFYAWVVHMQLVEFFLHILQDEKNDGLNKLITRVGIFINHAEPYVFYEGINMFENTDFINGVLMKIMMTLLFFPTVYYSRMIVRSDVKPTKHGCVIKDPSSPCKNGKLFWNWNYDGNTEYYYPLFVFSLVLLSLCGLNGKRSNFNAAMVVISYALSYYIYQKEKAVGSMWCFVSAFAPYILMALVR